MSKGYMQHGVTIGKDRYRVDEDGKLHLIEDEPQEDK